MERVKLKLGTKKLKAIIDRLEEVRGKRSRERFAADADLSMATTRGWVGSDPKAPDLPQLMRICEKLNLSPSWLLLGKGPKFLAELENTTRDTAEELRTHLLAELTAGVPAKRKAEVVGDLPPSKELLQTTVEFWRARVSLIAKERRAVHAQGLKAWIRRQKARGPSLEELGFFARLEDAVETGSDVLPAEVPESLLRKPVRPASEQLQNALILVDDGEGNLRPQFPRE